MKIYEKDGQTVIDGGWQDLVFSVGDNCVEYSLLDKSKVTVTQFYFVKVEMEKPKILRFYHAAKSLWKFI